MQNGLIAFNGNKDHKVKVLTSGASSCTYLSKKEYGERYDLKGALLRKEHEKYRLSRGIAANGNLAAMMTSGQIVAEKLTTKKDGSGFSVGFTYANEFDTADPKAAVKGLSDEELMAEMKRREEIRKQVEDQAAEKELAEEAARLEAEQAEQQKTEEVAA